MRILYVAPVAQRGGMEVVLLNLVRALDRSRLTPVVAFLEPGPFAREVEDAGARVHVVEAGRVRNLWRGARAVVRLRRLIRESRADLVHTLNAKAHLYGGSAAALAGVPCLYHLHGVPVPRASRDGVVSLLSVLVPARCTVACSNYVAKRFATIWRSHRDVAVFHNGVALEPGLNHPGGDNVRDELGVADSAPLVVMVCRLQRSKGVHVFVEAAARVARTCPEARFGVVGGALFGLEPGYPLELKQLAERLGVSSLVRFIGYRPDAQRFLKSADVVVHASIEPDSFPTVILEAMTLEKPVVATDLGGPREMVDDGVTGILVPPNSVGHLADAIVALLRAPERGPQMGEAAGLRFRREFTADRMARRFEGLYEELVGGRPVKQHDETRG